VNVTDFEKRSPTPIVGTLLFSGGIEAEDRLVSRDKLQRLTIEMSDLSVETARTRLPHSFLYLAAKFRALSQIQRIDSCPFRKLYQDVLIVQPAQDEDETMLRANSNHTPDERHGDFAPSARIEGVIEGLREGVDLIVVAAGGKRQKLLAEFVEPMRSLRKVNRSGLDARGLRIHAHQLVVVCTENLIRID
jgi:hypothetical protein